MDAQEMTTKDIWELGAEIAWTGYPGIPTIDEIINAYAPCYPAIDHMTRKQYQVLRLAVGITMKSKGADPDRI